MALIGKKLYPGHSIATRIEYPSLSLDMSIGVYERSFERWEIILSENRRHHIKQIFAWGEMDSALSSSCFDPE
jgi:hypothetical protein